jgi:hypothetical protein
MNSIHDEKQQQKQQNHNTKITDDKKKKKDRKGIKITPGSNIVKDIKDRKNTFFTEKKKENSFFSEKKKVPKNVINKCNKDIKDQNDNLILEKKVPTNATNKCNKHIKDQKNSFPIEKKKVPKTVINKCNGNVVTVIQNNSNLEAIRAAFASRDTLPSRLQSALGGASIELDNYGNIKITRQNTVNNYFAVKMMLRKNAMQGFLEWIQGRRGWTLATDKSPYLEYHRDLHEAYSISLRTLMKNHNDLRSYLVVLYYKQEPLTHENACDGDTAPKSRQNTQTLWKKVGKGESLQDAVGKLRPFLEVLRYFCTDPKERWTSIPWLVPIISQKACQQRLDRISRLVSTLMRTSDNGPDVPIHWAAHPPLNHYPRSTVTSTTMTELVIGVANILSNLFLQQPIFVSTLADVNRLLPKFSNGLENTERNNENLKVVVSGMDNNTVRNTFTTKSPDRPTKVNVSTSSTTAVNQRPRPPIADPVVPDLIIDLTNLNLSDDEDSVESDMRKIHPKKNNRWGPKLT